VELRTLDSLTLHPGHAVFAEPDEHEVELLAQDIQRRGLQHAIEALPDGQVVAGRKRLAALIKLGRKETRCRIRYDLAAQGEAAILQHLLADNLMRHDLTPLEKARAYLKLREQLNGRAAPGGGDKRDLLAEIFGCSGRTLDRYARVLDAPREVQDAVDRGHLSLIVANRIAGLPAKERDAIAKAIAAGEDPKTLLAQAPAPKSALVDLSHAARPSKLDAAVAELSRVVEDLKRIHTALALGVDRQNQQAIVNAISNLQEILA
jgi:ParB family chromosome partitioning protein